MTARTRRQWPASLLRIRKQATRRDRAANDEADVAAFVKDQAEVARHILGMSDRWFERLMQNPDALTASDPLHPELWEALLMERRLVADMFFFRFRQSPEALGPCWLGAKDAELRLNYALSEFHNGLVHESHDEVLARLATVQNAARAVLSGARRMCALDQTSESGEGADPPGASQTETMPGRGDLTSR